MVSAFVAQVNIVFQVIVFALLAVGFAVMRKRKIKLHAQLMLAAVVLNLVSFMAVMAPAWDNVGELRAGGLSVIAMAHVSLGGLAMLLSIWVVGTWLLPPLFLQSAKVRCYGKVNKRLMWAVLGLWLASLIMGFFLYLIINTTLLGSFPVIAEETSLSFK